MANKERTPAYLANLNSGPDDIFLDGKDYLQGLPLRRRSYKRKRPGDDVVGPPPISSLFHRITNTTASQLRFGIIFTSAILVGGFSIIKRRRFTERSEINKMHTPRRKKKKRRKKTNKNHTKEMSDCKQAKHNEPASGKKHESSLKQTNNEQSGDVSLLKEGVAFVTPCHHKVEITKSEESETVTVHPTRDQQPNNMHEETSLTATHSSNQNTMKIIYGSHNQLNSQANNFPINEIVSRWESLGLCRQKSLELAANAEMNWYFYQEIKQSVSSAAIHLFDQLGWHSLQILTQSEKHHREQLDAPAMDMLRRRRQEVKFSLLNTKLLCRCLFVALFARFIRHDNNLASLINAAFSTFLSNLCPECNTPIISDTMSNFLYYDLESWRNVAYHLMESMSSAWYCVGRLLCCTVCLGILHCVSRKLTYALLVSTLVPWREIITTGVVLVALNCLLTFSMLKRCSNFDMGLEKTGGGAVTIDPRQATDLYNRQINIYQALSYFISFCIGLFGIHGCSFEQVIIV